MHTKSTKHSPFQLDKRSKPEWNGVHVAIQDGETLHLRVESRKQTSSSTSAESSSSWEDLLQVAIEPLAAFTVEDQDVVWHPTVVELPAGSAISSTAISVWVWVELSLQRLTSFIRSSVKETTLVAKSKMLTRVKFECKARTPEQIKQEADMLAELRPQKGTMTKQDIVYMKDIWNKCLGWIEMTGESIVEGLFMRCPELITILGKIPAELMFDMLIGLIDMAVRSLDARTEVIARESYHKVPLGPKEDHPFHTLEEGFKQLAQLGMRPNHWVEARVVFLLSMEKANPYLEESDFEILDAGTKSCTFKFWNQYIMLPALEAIHQLDEIFEPVEHKQILKEMLKPVLHDKRETGMYFYKTLFTQSPELVPLFGSTDMNFLAGHLFDAIELLVESFNDFGSAINALHQLGKIHDNAKIPVRAYPALLTAIDTVFDVLPAYKQHDKARFIWYELFTRASLVTSRISFVSEKLLRKALEWSEQVAHELEWDSAFLAQRKIDIEQDIRSTGTYTHLEEELVHGARVSWRNSAKCVGRIAWNTMLVRDRRHVINLDHMFAECIEHQRLATADGSLKAVMTVFRPRKPGTRLGVRFWGLQLIRFACYEMEDGSLIGDRANRRYTKECIDFGWKPPEPRTEFDVLPIVIEDTISGETKMFEVPKEYHKVTMIEHPKFPDLAKLGLRWCVVPTVICFTMTLGGLQYPCCPFNGWFMETEITRDLIEPGRMDKLEAIAHAIGVDPTDEDDFWRERVAHETNKAVVYSFRRDGHSIVDHVTAQAQFLAHDMREKREGRECPAQWSWVVPSIGGATLPVWHHEMRDFYIEPQYQYQAELISLRTLSQIPEIDLFRNGDSSGDFSFERLLVLYASVTGTAEGHAYKVKKMLRPINVDVKSCEKVDPKTLSKEMVENGGVYSAILFITSTFGEGDPPTSSAKFFEAVKTLPGSAMIGVKYSMMAIGSRVYPDFCQAGINLDKWFGNAGAEQLMPLRKADELDDQAGTVNQWINSIGAHFNVEQKKALILSGDGPTSASMNDDEGPPVTVDLLGETDKMVSEAIESEKKFEAIASHSDIGAVSRFLPAGFRLCRVTRNSELVDFSKPGSKNTYKSTRFLEFDLAGISQTETGSDPLVYETGDHAKIMPANFPNVVNEMCNCLGLAPGQWANVKVQEGMGRQLTASVARVNDILSYEIDLATQDSDGNLPLFQRLLDRARKLSSAGSENLDAGKQLALKAEISRLDAIIEQLAGKSGNTDKDLKEYKKAAISQVMENFLDVPAVLKEYPIASSKLSLADCIETLPRLKPRYYSIASAAELHPSTLQLTVGVLTVIHKSTSKARSGLCSNYLFGRTVSTATGKSPSTAFVRLGVNMSSFRLPSDLGCPVIMVGPGTGISPMMGFLQAREKAQADGVVLGPCMVFFGCRAECDFLHKEQMRAWEKSGVISSLQVAFSRMPGQPKEYVQHRISKIQDKVWAMLKDDKCHYYVCGDSNMAEDVYEELFRTAHEAGGLDHKESWEVFHKMKVEHRFQNDTWGVVSGRTEGLARQAEKKYNQAADWLAKMAEAEVKLEIAKANVEPEPTKADVKPKTTKADVKQVAKKADVKPVAKKTDMKPVESMKQVTKPSKQVTKTKQIANADDSDSEVSV